MNIIFQFYKNIVKVRVFVKSKNIYSKKSSLYVSHIITT
jgi:hypothetical protein